MHLRRIEQNIIERSIATRRHKYTAIMTTTTTMMHDNYDREGIQQQKSYKISFSNGTFIIKIISTKSLFQQKILEPFFYQYSRIYKSIIIITFGVFYYNNNQSLCRTSDYVLYHTLYISYYIQTHSHT